ncbi:S-protein [Populus alba x Populus x berolinensis]|nr:S-protein [Populus alba x Populus x berolinensis]
MEIARPSHFSGRKVKSNPFDMKAAILFPTVVAVAVILFISTGSGQVVPVAPWYHLHILNGLSHNKILLVHCKSKNNDLGVHNIPVNSEFDWSFRSNAWGTTLFWCYLAPDDHSHADFNAFQDKEKITDSCDGNGNCCWIAKDDGVYLRDFLKNSTDDLKYHWVAGT